MNIKKIFIVISIVLSLFTSSFSQDSQSKKQENEDPIIRVNTNVVQIDVTVVDEKGHQVKNLSEEDFEVYEGDKLQPITNFDYISNSNNSKLIYKESVGKELRKKQFIPPPQLQPENTQRVITLVIDDLGLSLEGVVNARELAKKFVDQQVQPNDLVAIVRTSKNLSILTQLTNDKRQLYSTIDKIMFSLSSRTGIDTQAEVNDPRGLPEDNTVLSLRAIEQIIRELSQIPGRKSILFFSNGLQLKNQGVVDGIVKASKQANQASIVIHTLDAKTLQALNINASDQLRDPRGKPVGALIGDDVAKKVREVSEERLELLEDQTQGMSFLAKQTGGLFSRNIEGGIEELLTEQSGYYLIGYSPSDEETMKKESHQLKVKVKRPGVKVISRKQFYGLKQEIDKISKSPQERIVEALKSPFINKELTVKLTPIFTYSKKEGHSLGALLLIKPDELSFTSDSDETSNYKLELEVANIIYDINGKLIDNNQYTHNIKVSKETYLKILKEGLALYKSIDVKEPGVYQMRSAVYDNKSGHLGSSHQIVEIPNTNQGKLTLSGIFLTSPQQNLEIKETEESLSDILLVSAAREFKTGSIIQYTFNIYNAKVDKNLELKVRLLRGEQVVFEGKPTLLDLSRQESSIFTFTGKLQLGKDLLSGEYNLQLFVTSDTASKNPIMASQIIDFKVAN